MSVRTVAARRGGADMGFRFRKSIRLMPGVRINLTQRGVTSTSVGKRGAMLNFSKRGTRGTIGLPGSGLSYSEMLEAPAQRSPRSGKSLLIWLFMIVCFIAFLFG